MKIIDRWKTCSGQDGIIISGEMLNFDANGKCRVVSTSEKKQISEFTLDKAELIVPHSNAVCLGTERLNHNDEFPLLYSNMYNNMAKESDRMEGTCLVYRIYRTADSYATNLVQIIRIGFTDDLSLWKSLPDNGDVRSYGNFVIDADAGKLYAFVMRDKEQVTRFFRFSLPKADDGEMNRIYGVPQVTLTADMIEDSFDVPYSQYIQGACCHNGLIYSLEGFRDEIRRPAIRIIDVNSRRQVEYIDLWGMGLDGEPEFVDFSGDIMYYRDGSGNVFVWE